MQLDALETLVAVADSASFSKAAQQLNLTQPAVTKRIQALEADVGTPLLDRVGKSVMLTPAGELVVAQTRRIHEVLADTRNQLSHLTANVTGRLSLATSHHIGLHRLAPVLQSFTAQYPDVQLNITFEDSEVAHELVRHGDVELAVVTLNPQGDAQLTSRLVWHDPLVFVVDDRGTADYTQDGSSVKLEALAMYPCVLPGLSTYTGKIVIERFAEIGVQLEPTMSTNYLETIGMLVRVGLGWSVLPRSMSEGLSELEVATAPMARQLGMVTDPRRAASSAGRAFRQVLESYADVTPT